MQPDQTNTDDINMTPQALQQRDQAIWKLRIRGWNQERIADHFGLDQSTVSRTLKRVRQQLAAEFTSEAAEMIAEQTQQLFYVISEALDAWQCTRPQPAPPPQQESVQGEAQPSHHNNPSADQSSQPKTPNAQRPTPPSGHVYLRVALQALSAIRELWGLTATRRTLYQAHISEPEPEQETPLSPPMERLRQELRAYQQSLATNPAAG